ncbi:MAG TPA: hypothetical protein VGI83_07610 [Gemmatimonadales bacterium]
MSLVGQDALPVWTRPLFHLRASQELRILTAANEIYVGNHVGLTGDTITLTVPHIGRRPFPVDSVVQAWRPTDGSRTGFLVAGGVGAGLSVLLGAFSAELTYHDYSAWDGIRVGAVGGLLFGCVGYIIGGFIPGWHQIYERPDPLGG